MRKNARNVGYLRTLLMVHEGMRVNLRNKMVVAGNTSPHPPSSLNMQTPSETPPKTLIGRLLLSGRSADEPESAEKVYPWYVVLWLTVTGRLFLEPRIPTGHSPLGRWCALSAGNGRAVTGNASGSSPGIFSSGPALIRRPGLDRSIRKSAHPAGRARSSYSSCWASPERILSLP